MFAASNLVLAGLGLLTSSSLDAQSGWTDRSRTWPVDSVLARFEAGERSGANPNAANRLVYDILYLPRVYSARKDSLLDGLERMALTSDADRVRQGATWSIAFAGQGGHIVPGGGSVLARLLRIYSADTRGSLRFTIVNTLPLLTERRAAAAFLRTIAAEPDTSGGHGHHGYFSHGDLRIEALARLAEMGEEGRAVLQAMHRSGGGRSPQARAILESMARRGFPVGEARREP